MGTNVNFYQTLVYLTFFLNILVFILKEIKVSSLNSFIICVNGNYRVNMDKFP